ncbi:type II toxin-antitoxin system Phd/YefM family antitoxin [Fervidobacterium nodosum]|uniref:Antitoxin n=1 Tax=Fervidobacterium nodosum (strain ATCC 35602 / DSM 5306 / Rt17-B1) TaxID=381764 RepID=A7HJE8_FERNB|nr:type II toxin-antitoxin system Phd/YefM family antitoxin [Fervidobacterium nodosum]ABS60031.1 prevent-host-death family protein [Fervidobacterium nodosum Rt17-B1]PHJ13780.1 prevent-host-death protein [Fervidobacterium sp. SC_NGM5_G05]
MRFKTDFYSLADAKAKFSEVVEISENVDVVITKNGKPAAVIINYEKYNKILDFIDKVWDLYLLDLGDPSVFKDIKLEDIFDNYEKKE